MYSTLKQSKYFFSRNLEGQKMTKKAPVTVVCKAAEQAVLAEAWTVIPRSKSTTDISCLCHYHKLIPNTFPRRQTFYWPTEGSCLEQPLAGFSQGFSTILDSLFYNPLKMQTVSFCEF